MRIIHAKLVWLLLICALMLAGQGMARPPLVRAWTIREVGNYKKIPTAALRAKMAQRGVLFGVNEPYDQSKVDGTTLLLKQLYRDAGVNVTVVAARIAVGANAVKVEYVVHKQP